MTSTNERIAKLRGFVPLFDTLTTRGFIVEGFAGRPFDLPLRDFLLHVSFAVPAVNLQRAGER